MSEQPDDLVIALAEVMAKADVDWFPGNWDTHTPLVRAEAIAARERAAAAALASGLVLPAADVIPKQAAETEWGVRELGVEGGGVYGKDDADITTETDAREFHAAYVTEAPGGAEVVRRSVHRGPWEAALVAGGES